jgi:hypothetical protein
MRPVTQGAPSSQVLNLGSTTNALQNKTFMANKQALNTSGGYLQSGERNGLFSGSGAFN